MKKTRISGAHGGQCGKIERLPEEILEGAGPWHEAAGFCGTEGVIVNCVKGY